MNLLKDISSNKWWASLETTSKLIIPETIYNQDSVVKHLCNHSKLRLLRRTFRPAILEERRPIQRGEDIQIFLTWRLVQFFCSCVKLEVVWVEIEERDERDLGMVRRRRRWWFPELRMDLEETTPSENLRRSPPTAPLIVQWDDTIVRWIEMDWLRREGAEVNNDRIRFLKSKPWFRPNNIIGFGFFWFTKVLSSEEPNMCLSAWRPLNPTKRE